ncbi:MAG: putative anti-sigma regulatory factor, serine/threonine protein kinase [Nocardioidaceae bacterium]|nr:putative anti-sigma regulatory factor, serine/threonine protein kinase [Nocardioidaceae bacterium]
MSTPSPVALALPFVASSAAVARNQLKEWLVGLGQPLEVIEDSRLVLTELVGNAVRHAAPLADGTVRVTWARQDSGLDIAVTDGGGPTIPHQLPAAEAEEISGRGLSIVEQLSSRWWLDRSPAESTVHAVVGLG